MTSTLSFMNPFAQVANGPVDLNRLASDPMGLARLASDPMDLAHLASSTSFGWYGDETTDDGADE